MRGNLILLNVDIMVVLITDIALFQHRIKKHGVGTIINKGTGENNKDDKEVQNKLGLSCAKLRVHFSSI